MNPRQRRGVLVLLLAAVGAIAVFFGVVSYVNEVGRQVNPLIKVLALRKAVPAYQPITLEDLQYVQIPKRWAPTQMLTDAAVGDVVGRVPTTDLSVDTALQKGMLVAAPALRGKQRAVTMLVDIESGVAGKIQAGSIVDVQAVYASQDGVPAYSEYVMSAVQVIDIGLGQPATPDNAVTAGDEENADGKSADQPAPTTTGGTAQTAATLASGKAVPVTLAMGPVQSLRLTFSQAQAQRVRLVLHRPGDASTISRAQSVYPKPSAR